MSLALAQNNHFIQRFSNEDRNGKPFDSIDGRRLFCCVRVHSSSAHPKTSRKSSFADVC
jgi:hypothetical protein